MRVQSGAGDVDFDDIELNDALYAELGLTPEEVRIHTRTHTYTHAHTQSVTPAQYTLLTYALRPPLHSCCRCCWAAVLLPRNPCVCVCVCVCVCMHRLRTSVSGLVQPTQTQKELSSHLMNCQVCIGVCVS